MDAKVIGMSGVVKNKTLVCKKRAFNSGGPESNITVCMSRIYYTSAFNQRTDELKLDPDVM